jgi:hypothetical protein
LFTGTRGRSLASLGPSAQAPGISLDIGKLALRVGRTLRIALGGNIGRRHSRGDVPVRALICGSVGRDGLEHIRVYRFEFAKVGGLFIAPLCLDGKPACLSIRLPGTPQSPAFFFRLRFQLVPPCLLGHRSQAANSISCVDAFLIMPGGSAILTAAHHGGLQQYRIRHEFGHGMRRQFVTAAGQRAEYTNGNRAPIHLVYL